MSSVVRRTVRSSPHRNTSDTWGFIVDLLTQGKDNAARTELLSVSGIASSIIAEHSPKDAAITVVCDGPRTRIYCLYDEDAIDGSDAKEDGLGFDPLKGEWAVSLPCPAEDLGWVQRALKDKSSRITARDQSETLGEDTKAEASASSQELTVNLKALLKS